MTVSASPTPTRRLAPGPKGMPVFGNIFDMQKDVLHSYLNFWRQYGDVVHLKLGPISACLIAHPEHVHHVLVKNQKNYIKGIGYDGLRLLLGQGLVTSDGDLWRQQRRLLQPTFTPAAITQFYDLMVGLTQQALDRWQPLVERGQEFSMDVEMRRLTMSIIGQAMFSYDLGEASSQVGQALQEVFAFIPERTTNPAQLPLNVPLPKHQRFHRNMAIINAFIDERLAEGRRQPNSNNLLGILLQARDEDTHQVMTEQQLRDEVVTLFFAGFETTARSLTWGWYLLAQHPQVADRLAAEAQQVLGGRRPEVPDLFNLNYTRQVVDETLRLYPPTALLARQNLEADEIGGYPITPRTMVILMPYLVHRHPSVWPNPETFDPDRFAPAAADNRPKSAYIPFASGPRVCLGNNFALMEMVLALSMAAARYRLTLVDPTPIGVEFVGTTRPLRPVMMRVQAR